MLGSILLRLGDLTYTFLSSPHPPTILPTTFTNLKEEDVYIIVCCTNGRAFVFVRFVYLHGVLRRSMIGVHEVDLYDRHRAQATIDMAIEKLFAYDNGGMIKLVSN